MTLRVGTQLPPTRYLTNSEAQYFDIKKKHYTYIQFKQKGGEKNEDREGRRKKQEDRYKTWSR